MLQAATRDVKTLISQLEERGREREKVVISHGKKGELPTHSETVACVGN